MITPGLPPKTGMERMRLPDFLEAFTGSCLVLSPELDVIAASDPYVQLLRKSNSSIIGRRILDILPDPIVAGSDLTPARVQSSLEYVRRNRSAHSIISQFAVTHEEVVPVTVNHDADPALRADNKLQESWAITHTPLLDKDGHKLLFIVHSLHDVTGMTDLTQGSKRLLHGQGASAGQIETAEEATNSLLAKQLRDSEERFHELLEGASDAVLEVAEDGKILLANSAAIAMFGYAADELIGQEVETLLIPGERREAHRHHREKYGHNPRMRRMGSGLELSACRKDGSVFAVEISLVPVWSHEKSSVITIVHDISKRKRIEEKLRQAQKLEALGRLAGGTAHEFNNLLAVIMGSAELITMSDGSEEQIARHVDRIRRAAGDAGELARQLLTFGRKQMLLTEILDLNSVVAEMSRSSSELLGDSIEFQIVPADVPVWIRADRLQIEQVISNLLSNARNAMPHGGKLKMIIEAVEFNRNNRRVNPGLAPGRHALLTITDTGTGMTSEVKARLFEPFFSTKGLAEATGMGLATAYGIITQSGGTILVESQPNQGSTFHVYLPIADEEAVKTAVALAPARHTRRGTETILLLEDQPDLLMMTGEFLRQCGYRVLSASHPDEALRIGTDFQGTIHLLITDILMPGMDGREFATKCKAIRPGLPVLYVSGYTSDILEHLQADEAFMSKPFATEDLGLKVREMLGRTTPKNQ